MKLMRFSALLLILGLAAPTLCRADDVYQVIVKKAEKKKATGWSLSEWLETRNRMALMDMWLALHTPSPYEFSIGGNYQFAQRDGDPYKGGAYYLTAFATIFGLEFERDQSAEKIINGLFLLRLLGLHSQSTNITLHGGIRYAGNDSVRSPVAGVTTDLYFTRYFGVEGMYRHIFQSSVAKTGYRLHGDRYEVGAFIDFKFLRLYGNYFHEQETTNTTVSQPSHPAHKGGLLGVRLFF